MSNRQTARKGEDYFIRLKDVFLFPVNVELASELSPTFRKKSDLRKCNSLHGIKVFITFYR